MCSDRNQSAWKIAEVFPGKRSLTSPSNTIHAPSESSTWDFIASVAQVDSLRAMHLPGRVVSAVWELEVERLD